MVRSFDVSALPLFREIRALLLRALAGREVNGDAEAEAVLETHGQTDLRKNTPLMLDLEGRLVRLLDTLGVTGFKALQFPVNVRMLGPVPPGAAGRPFATDWLHCDLWSGAPRDSVNFFLYVHVSPDCPRLDLFETLPDTHPTAVYRGPYAGAPLRREDLVPVRFDCAAGNFAVFPTLTPHQTVRPSPPDGGRGGWRMSVDFRARFGDPYELEPHADIEAAFSADKMNSLGVYWSYPPRGFARLEDKVAYEMLAAKAKGGEVVRRRAGYLAKHFPEVSVR
jgi:hypothetical protein